MNPAQLLAHFDRISDAPDAVTRLRRFVLDLAVRGKLVPQDSGDEPAVELLKQIRAEKTRRIMQGSLPRQKPIAEVDEREFDFPVPSGWQWVRMADVMKLWNGYAFKSADFQEQGVPVVRIGDLQNGEVVLSEAVRISDAIADSVGSDFEIPEGALLIAMSGATTGKVAINNTSFRSMLNQRVGRVEIFLANTDFIRFFFETMVARNLSISFGTAIPNLSAKQINETPIPLPPLAEQHRIVAKVDELMALCDRLEAAQRERDQRRDRLNRASLHRLNNGADAGAFRDHARFHLRHLPRLTTRPELIRELHQTILNLAVRGKLVPQYANDEPALELLQRIKSGQRNQVKNEAVKKCIALPPVDFDSAPYLLPDGWAWARFPELGHFNRGKSRHRPRNDPSLYVDGRYKLVQTGDVARARGVITTHTGLYNDVGLAQSRLWPKGTMCITIAANIADTAILGFDACIPDSVVGFIPNHEFQSARYFDYFMRTAKAHLVDFAPSTAQKNINIGILEKVLIPLPPLAEQHRIVAKVDELMKLCDQLESQLTTTQTQSRRLLEAILHEALASAEPAPA